MAAKWIETVTGSLEQKKQYKANKARMQALPGPYRTAVEAIERYLTYFGAINKGDVLVTMFQDLGDLFEQAAADGTPIRDLIGADPVEFVEAFLANYAEGQWISKERQRLIDTIDGITEA
ncbi:DUF1048 domain-containing protein [Specibacter sp. NPDC078709]|uniref:DUF1048 domain-containing protein n=1 Tax=Specibacter sp. NPDC078709 TaxID=3154364 RepID=UPI0034379DA2